MKNRKGNSQFLMENKRKFKRYVQYLLCDDSAKVKTKICNGNIKIRYPTPKYENVFLTLET